MAKVKIYDALEGMFLGDAFVEGTMTVVGQTASKLVIEDESGAQIIFSGSKFKYEDGIPQKGTIGTVTFVSSEGETLVKYTDGKWKLTSDFVPANLQSIWGIASYLNKGDDTITGSSLGDDLFAGDNPGDDIMIGLVGDDYFSASAGDNTYKGGAGFDQLNYGSANVESEDVIRGVKIDAEKGIAKNPWGGKDSFDSIEGFRGTDLKDTMSGSKLDERFMGYAGDDFIDGGKGFDTIRYDRDHNKGGSQGIVADLSKGTVTDTFGDTDTLTKIEAVEGSIFGDTMTGNGSDNWFNGGDGIDSFDGKGGDDTVSFWNNTIETGAIVDMSLETGQVVNDGFGNTETLVSIEHIQGSYLSDTITLGARDNTSSWGDEGDDTLVSGEGKQHMGGGGGMDTFVFLTASGIGPRSGLHDEIGDFSQSDGDQIDLSAIASFAFIGSAAFGGDGDAEIRAVKIQGDTFVIGDVDGNGTEDFALELSGKINLVSDDFILA